MANYDYGGSPPGTTYIGDDLIDQIRKQQTFQRMAQPFYTNTGRTHSPMKVTITVDGYSFEVSDSTLSEDLKTVIRKCTAARLLDILSGKKVSSAQKINLREMIFSNDLENLTLAEQTIYSLFDQNEQ
jgi:hypothetical protein